MSLDDRLTRIPRAFDPALGREARAACGNPAGGIGDLIEGAGGSSPYLKGLIQREAAWMMDALEAPEAALDALCETARDPADDIRPRLREAKRRVALLVGLMDLGGVWPLSTVTNALTNFAGQASAGALTAALTPLLSRDKIPGKTIEDAASGAGMVILAMGKMGACELNYSSDIDLICLFDQDQFTADSYGEARAAFVRATREMTRILSDVTAEGYVFRTDLRLRPDPSVTPVCLAMEAAERYYESLGRAWERAAHIKARPVAGDVDAGARYIAALRPFVWRKHLDFAAIEDAHNIRLAIRSHRGEGAAIRLPGHNVKLGRGGIREIEFFAQTRQLIAGGRDPDLRAPGTVTALARLAEKGWIATEVAEGLAGHYEFLRTVEHRVQMVQDAQIHTLPYTEAEFERLACLMGTDRQALESELAECLAAVHDVTEGFFAPERPRARTASKEVCLDPETLARWRKLPALRSERARVLLDRLRPALEARLSEAARPDDAKASFEAFLAGLPAGVQLLSLFEANPHLIDLVFDVIGTSPDLATHLSQNAGVLDAVIGGAFFAPWPGPLALTDLLRADLARQAEDYEAELDAARRWMKEWHFRVGVFLLRGLVGAEEAGRHYADLAEAVMRALWPAVQREFATRHGDPPGRGAVVVAMGALGAGAMNARSDLDLIVVYDAGGAELSDGPRPLTSGAYYARLTKSLITALSAPMAEGRLYEVDMRLRPSGTQGPVAASWESFRTYQRTKAWTWEHMALTRARPIAGAGWLAADILHLKDEVVGQPRDPAALARDVTDMRRRIADAKPPAGWLDIKAGFGRMQDIEMAAQAGALLTGKSVSLADGLAALCPEAAGDLCVTHALYWQIQQAGRLIAPNVADPEGLGAGGRAFLLRLTGEASLADMQKTLSDRRDAADAAITAALTRLEKETRR